MNSKDECKIARLFFIFKMELERLTIMTKGESKEKGKGDLSEINKK